MDKLTQYLRQPFIRYPHPWVVMGLPAICVIFVLTIFEPFYFRLLDARQLGVILGFAFMAVLDGVIVAYFFPLLFRKFYAPEKWTIGKEFLYYFFILLLAGLLTVVWDIGVLQGGHPRHLLWNIGIDMLAGFTVGLIPVVLIFLLSKNRMQRQELADAEEMNRRLQRRIDTELGRSQVITLTGSTRETVVTEPENIVYLEASGNYVEVYYTDDSGKVQHKLLRTTLRQMEDALQSYAFMCRTHRAFIVNLHKVVCVNAYASGYKLLLSGTPDNVYVSRNYLKDFKEKMRSE